MEAYLLKTQQLSVLGGGVILGWLSSWEVFPGAHEWGQSALEKLVFVCGPVYSLHE